MKKKVLCLLTPVFLSMTLSNTVFAETKTADIPIRSTLESLGADVKWNSAGKEAIVYYDSNTAVFTANSDIMEFNGNKIKLDTKAVIINSQLYVSSDAIEYFNSSNSNENTQNEAAGIDNTKWNYNEEDGVYWQTGIVYCSNPVDTKYETLGIFVPEQYFNSEDNGDGTYTCVLNTSAEVNGYNCETAPIVIPVNTPGYSAMTAPTDYVSDSAEYTKAGYVYVNAGCRGRDEGAPSGVTDLKAAVRYIRYFSDSIAGSTDRIFTFGMSGGGAQSALMGATGNSDLYTPYLEKIGAVEESDAVAGSMCWCPITNLDTANEAYEWNMGVTRENLDDFTQELSDNLANYYGEYINSIDLKDENGNTLTLEKSENGIYQSGTYYDYVKGVIERSLNNFLEDTQFPYTPSSGNKQFGMGNMNGNIRTDRNGGMGRQDGEPPENFGENIRIEDIDGISRNDVNDNSVEQKTYNSPEEYIAELNKDGEWIKYENGYAEITSVEDFVKNCKNASKNVGAFDDLSATQGENTLFGYADGKGAHFDSVMAGYLKGSEYEDAFNEDLSKTDALGNKVSTRLNMYNPMYYLNKTYSGYNTSDVAQYWRIRTGINQGDTALSTEINLSLALKEFGKNVDFETIWGEGHTQAERKGSSSENFIEWVNSCLKD